MSRPFTPSETHHRSIAKYKRKAAIYDTTTSGTDTIRHRTIELLNLEAGQTVLDVGAGSGVSIPLLLDKVGPSGHVVGFDQSQEMLALAQRKQERFQWQNVSLQFGFAESVQFQDELQQSGGFDALLFHYTHDILQSEEAISNLLQAAKPGARVAIAGMKNFPWWTGPLTIVSFCKNYAWNGNKRGLWKPWARIEPHLSEFNRASTHVGMGYIAQGIVNK